jgi:RNA polymerase sigma-70 factor (ECF subfamily)
MDEADLIDRCRRNEPDAWRELVSAYHKRLWLLVCGVLRDPDEANDAVQDAWVRIVRHIGRFRNESSFETWAAGIAIRLALSRLRSRRDFTPIEDEEPPFLEDQGSVGTELRLDLQTALETLPARNRIALLLHYGEGYTFQEMSVILGVPSRTAANHAYQGLSLLRESLIRLDNPEKTR